VALRWHWQFLSVRKAQHIAIHGARPRWIPGAAVSCGDCELLGDAADIMARDPGAVAPDLHTVGTNRGETVTAIYFQNHAQPVV
jgi:hypothetical protein